MSSNETTAPLVALTIAGFDPSGGAGVIADIKTFTAFGCFATAAITSLTYQNTLGVYGAEHQSGAAVRAQVLPVIEDFTIACVKTGMLPTREVISEVARLFHETTLPAPVVDPVVRSTSGFDLIDDRALAALVRELLPLARIVTPNIPEAERMTGLRIEDEDGMRRAARAIRALGARAVLIKGGHLGQRTSVALPSSIIGQQPEKNAEEGKTANVKEGESSPVALDLLDDEGRLTLFSEERVNSTSTHGTGCTLAAAIAACLGRGLTLVESVSAAKSFVTDAIRQAVPLGHGHGPLNHSVPARYDARNFQVDEQGHERDDGRQGEREGGQT
ncbi:MAG: hydroxymethylpyrimidine/phosphomethylpyrimidine kinase [Blastocatellia bacterium]|jgi:hydroxymethylpyrimidine kinase/phosphomethylpyrimidine kinase|nr:hydroxymethylpyrimidine/phosphomethylpyrimidine kinase [Blastocatellia bacterium]